MVTGSLRLSILVICVVITVSLFLLSVVVSILNGFFPVIQFCDYEVIYNSSANREIMSVGQAYDFIKSDEGENITLTLQSLTSNYVCEGFRFEIFVNEKNVKYVICQNGYFQKYKPIPCKTKTITDKIIEFPEIVYKAWLSIFE